MLYSSSKHQLNHLIDLIGLDFTLFAPVAKDNVFVYQKVEKSQQISWHCKRTILPFKKILFPNRQDVLSTKKPIALLGLPLCDIAALNIFLKQFENSGLLHKRADIFVVGSECIPDEHCFCDQFNLNKLHDYDLFVTKNGDDYLIDSKGWKAKEYVAKAGLKKSIKKFELTPKAKSEKIDLEKTRENIEDKDLTHHFWQGISNNCFGCGACSAVCPLCFCFDQDFINQIDGSCTRCINWTSCFAADFSQIQFGHDLRPNNVDRLYNWYHHKFVRAPYELKYPLCVGCGRCITACTAHLNIKSIIKALNKKYG